MTCTTPRNENIDGLSPRHGPVLFRPVIKSISFGSIAISLPLFLAKTRRPKKGPHRTTEGKSTGHTAPQREKALATPHHGGEKHWPHRTTEGKSTGHTAPRRGKALATPHHRGKKHWEHTGEWTFVKSSPVATVPRGNLEHKQKCAHSAVKICLAFRNYFDSTRFRWRRSYITTTLNNRRRTKVCAAPDRKL